MQLPPVRRLTPLAGVALAASLLAACTSGSAATPSGGGAASPAPAAGSPAAASVAPAAAGGVTVKDFAFAPATLTVPAGTTVTWTNQDTAGHTVTADDGSFDSKTIASGATFSQAFATAGTFAYHCNIHSSMTATVVVQ